MQRSVPVLLLIAYLAFVSLGLPDGLLGVAWPSIGATFARPLGDLGLLLVMLTVGFITTSFNSGRLVSRLGVGGVLFASGTLVATGLFGYAAAQAWWVVVGASLLLGMGGGAVDAGINAYAAAHFRPRHVNWLHAFYGLGATLGPLIMTVILSLEHSWRWGYVLVGLLLSGLALTFGWTRRLWQSDSSAATPAGSDDAGLPVTMTATLRRPLVWLGIALFFVYTGLEVTAGQWSYSLFTVGRDISPTIAGTWVSIYWGSLTLGRLVFGVLVERFQATAILRWSTVAVLAGALLLWLDLLPALSFLGLAVMGFMLAPVFPLLIAQTPARLGAGYATHAIGFQIAAANLGAASVPGGTGALVGIVGIEIVGLLLFVAALLLLLLHEFLLVATPARSW